MMGGLKAKRIEGLKDEGLECDARPEDEEEVFGG